MSAYKWKTGSQIKTNANIAGAVCEELEQTVGLTAQTLLDASRPEDAPLHNEFEWNDEKAAEEYRQMQARYIIRSLCIDAEIDGKVEPVRAYFTVAGSQYENIAVIVSEQEKRIALLDVALKELKAFERKYKQLVELQPIMDAIEQVAASGL